jgi:hypothetical protein
LSSAFASVLAYFATGLAIGLYTLAYHDRIPPRTRLALDAWIPDRLRGPMLGLFAVAWPMLLVMLVQSHLEVRRSARVRRAMAYAARRRRFALRGRSWRSLSARDR